MKLRFAFLLTILAGCSGMPGQVSTTASDFDGHKEVYLEPGTVRTPGAMLVFINLGAHWTSNDPETVYFIAKSPQEINYIPADGGLQFSVNGQVTKLDSPYNFTDHNVDSISGVVWAESSRIFTAPLSFAESLTEGTKVKLLINQSEYYEGELNSGPATAYDGLQDFLAKVRSISPRESEQSAGLSD